MTAFSRALNEFTEYIDRTANRRIRRIALKAFQEINRESPVDKGTFRANWNVSVGRPDRSVDMSRTQDAFRERESIASATIMNEVRLGTSAFISNSVPYAIQIEDGYGGSPRVQKPEGVVEPAVTVIRNAIESGRL